ncbi:MAG: 16S rRNA (adenine(1518)-N(6)/adenine(1519)-N(6))-dimethyltransferase RsmA [Vampirovibrio sp.]|nr:16S rRNA (adenine(1518)-N(6)/adenine(1519)-N(6))-dimethyltransferase RsmA [Vampirovibrio sp.]
MSGLFEEAKRLRLKKRFSQNFLIDEAILDRIVGLLSLSSNETVLEIGPGAGFLTERLLPGTGQVIAVDVDPRMVQYLSQKFSAEPTTPKDGLTESLALVQHDILKFPFEKIPVDQFQVVGNLPYNITSPILFSLVGELDTPKYPLRNRLSRITLMVQKEVGERITATPGEKAYNALSVASQFWFEPELAFMVPAGAFYPKPAVDSAVITLTPRAAPAIEVMDYKMLSRLVKTAFNYRRKTLRNALLHGGWIPASDLDTLLNAVGIDGKIRPQQLSITDFGHLANEYAKTHANLSRQD